MDRLRLSAMVVVIVVLLAVALWETSPIGSTSVSYTGFTVGGKHFTLTYVAENNSAIERGLMDTKVTANTTMLFVFPHLGTYPFWMYGVNSSLDIIWINAAGNTGRVVYMVTDAPSCQVSVLCANYQPSAGANLVLEAKAGFAEANGVAVGTTIVFD